MTSMSGFMPIAVIIAVITFVIVGGGGYFALQYKKEIITPRQSFSSSSPTLGDNDNLKPKTENIPQNIQHKESTQRLLPIASSPKPSSSYASTPLPLVPIFTPPLTSPCVHNASPVFTHHFTDLTKVNYIVPPPTMGAGPSLKPHGYIGTDHARVPVYAPTALTLYRGSHYIDGPYMFDFKASCEVMVRFGHITEPVEKLASLLPAEPQAGSQSQELSPLTFAAGELIAHTTGTSLAGNWDFGVYNTAVRNRYADDPIWNTSEVYTTAVCPFDYFTSELKTDYVVKFNPTILGGNPPHGESFCK